MDFIVKLLFMGGKYISQAAGRTILEIYLRSKDIGRHITLQYEKTSEIIKPYDSMLELLNDRAKETEDDVHIAHMNNSLKKQVEEHMNQMPKIKSDYINYLAKNHSLLGPVKEWEKTCAKQGLVENESSFAGGKESDYDKIYTDLCTDLFRNSPIGVSICNLGFNNLVQTVTDYSESNIVSKASKTGDLTKPPQPYTSRTFTEISDEVPQLDHAVLEDSDKNISYSNVEIFDFNNNDKQSEESLGLNLESVKKYQVNFNTKHPISWLYGKDASYMKYLVEQSPANSYFNAKAIGIESVEGIKGVSDKKEQNRCGRIQKIERSTKLLNVDEIIQVNNKNIMRGLRQEIENRMLLIEKNKDHFKDFETNLHQKIIKSKLRQTASDVECMSSLLTQNASHYSVFENKLEKKLKRKVNKILTKRKLSSSRIANRKENLAESVKQISDLLKINEKEFRKLERKITQILLRRGADAVLNVNYKEINKPICKSCLSNSDEEDKREMENILEINRKVFDNFEKDMSKIVILEKNTKMDEDDALVKEEFIKYHVNTNKLNNNVLAKNKVGIESDFVERPLKRTLSSRDKDDIRERANIIEANAKAFELFERCVINTTSIKTNYNLQLSRTSTPRSTDRGSGSNKDGLSREENNLDDFNDDFESAKVIKTLKELLEKSAIFQPPKSYTRSKQIKLAPTDFVKIKKEAPQKRYNREKIPRYVSPVKTKSRDRNQNKSIGVMNEKPKDFYKEYVNRIKSTRIVKNENKNNMPEEQSQGTLKRFTRKTDLGNENATNVSTETSLVNTKPVNNALAKYKENKNSMVSLDSQHEISKRTNKTAIMKNCDRRKQTVTEKAPIQEENLFSNFQGKPAISEAVKNRTPLLHKNQQPTDGYENTVGKCKVIKRDEVLPNHSDYSKQPQMEGTVKETLSNNTVDTSKVEDKMVTKRNVGKERILCADIQETKIPVRTKSETVKRSKTTDRKLTFKEKDRGSLKDTKSESSIEVVDEHNDKYNLNEKSDLSEQHSKLPRYTRNFASNETSRSTSCLDNIKLDEDIGLKKKRISRLEKANMYKHNENFKVGMGKSKLLNLSPTEKIAKDDLLNVEKNSKINEVNQNVLQDPNDDIIEENKRNKSYIVPPSSFKKQESTNKSDIRGNEVEVSTLKSVDDNANSETVKPLDECEFGKNKKKKKEEILRNPNLKDNLVSANDIRYKIRKVIGVGEDGSKPSAVNNEETNSTSSKIPQLKKTVCPSQSKTEILRNRDLKDNSISTHDIRIKIKKLAELSEDDSKPSAVNNEEKDSVSSKISQLQKTVCPSQAKIETIQEPGRCKMNPTDHEVKVDTILDTKAKTTGDSFIKKIKRIDAVTDKTTESCDSKIISVSQQILKALDIIEKASEGAETKKSEESTASTKPVNLNANTCIRESKSKMHDKSQRGLKCALDVDVIKSSEINKEFDNVSSKKSEGVQGTVTENEQPIKTVDNISKLLRSDKSPARISVNAEFSKSQENNLCKTLKKEDHLDQEEGSLKKEIFKVREKSYDRSCIKPPEIHTKIGADATLPTDDRIKFASKWMQIAKTRQEKIYNKEINLSSHSKSKDNRDNKILSEEMDLKYEASLPKNKEVLSERKDVKLECRSKVTFPLRPTNAEKTVTVLQKERENNLEKTYQNVDNDGRISKSPETLIKPSYSNNTTKSMIDKTKFDKSDSVIKNHSMKETPSDSDHNKQHPQSNNSNSFDDNNPKNKSNTVCNIFKNTCANDNTKSDKKDESTSKKGHGDDGINIGKYNLKKIIAFVPADLQTFERLQKQYQQIEIEGKADSSHHPAAKECSREQSAAKIDENRSTVKTKARDSENRTCEIKVKPMEEKQTSEQNPNPTIKKLKYSFIPLRWSSADEKQKYRDLSEGKDDQNTINKEKSSENSGKNVTRIQPLAAVVTKTETDEFQDLNLQHQGTFLNKIGQSDNKHENIPSLSATSTKDHSKSESFTPRNEAKKSVPENVDRKHFRFSTSNKHDFKNNAAKAEPSNSNIFQTTTTLNKIIDERKQACKTENNIKKIENDSPITNTERNQDVKPESEPRSHNHPLIKDESPLEQLTKCGEDTEKINEKINPSPITNLPFKYAKFSFSPFNKITKVTNKNIQKNIEEDKETQNENKGKQCLKNQSEDQPTSENLKEAAVIRTSVESKEFIPFKGIQATSTSLQQSLSDKLSKRESNAALDEKFKSEKLPEKRCATISQNDSRATKIPKLISETLDKNINYDNTKQEEIKQPITQVRTTINEKHKTTENKTKLESAKTSITKPQDVGGEGTQKHKISSEETNLNKNKIPMQNIQVIKNKLKENIPTKLDVATAKLRNQIAARYMENTISQQEANNATDVNFTASETSPTQNQNELEKEKIPQEKVENEEIAVCKKTVVSEPGKLFREAKFSFKPLKKVESLDVNDQNVEKVAKEEKICETTVEKGIEEQEDPLPKHLSPLLRYFMCKRISKKNCEQSKLKSKNDFVKHLDINYEISATQKLLSETSNRSSTTINTASSKTPNNMYVRYPFLKKHKRKKKIPRCAWEWKMKFVSQSKYKTGKSKNVHTDDCQPIEPETSGTRIKRSGNRDSSNVCGSHQVLTKSHTSKYSLFTGLPIYSGVSKFHLKNIKTKSSYTKQNIDILYK